MTFNRKTVAIIGLVPAMKVGAVRMNVKKQNSTKNKKSDQEEGSSSESGFSDVFIYDGPQTEIKLGTDKLECNPINEEIEQTFTLTKEKQIHQGPIVGQDDADLDSLMGGPNFVFGGDISGTLQQQKIVPKAEEIIRSKYAGILHSKPTPEQMNTLKVDLYNLCDGKETADALAKRYVIRSMAMMSARAAEIEKFNKKFLSLALKTRKCTFEKNQMAELHRKIQELKRESQASIFKGDSVPKKSLRSQLDAISMKGLPDKKLYFCEDSALIQTVLKQMILEKENLKQQKVVDEALNTIIVSEKVTMIEQKKITREVLERIYVSGNTSGELVTGYRAQKCLEVYFKQQNQTNPSAFLKELNYWRAEKQGSRILVKLGPELKDGKKIRSTYKSPGEEPAEKNCFEFNTIVEALEKPMIKKQLLDLHIKAGDFKGKSLSDLKMMVEMAEEEKLRQKKKLEVELRLKKFRAALFEELEKNLPNTKEDKESMEQMQYLSNRIKEMEEEKAALMVRLKK